MIAALDRRWASLSAAEKGRWHGVALCAALYLVHYVLLSTWFIEDAAITFSFARHLATGEGFVAYPGGERVEGFSNPSWTLLLALTDLLGVNPWIGAKLWGGLFGALTIPLGYLWARELATAPDGSRSGEDPGLLPLIAPLALAVSPQLVIWNASGLENAVVNLTLAAACVGMLRELRTGGRPWSAIPLGLLAISRPDAPLYCAVAAGLAVLFAFRARGLRAVPWVLGLAAISLAPLVLWEAFAWWYFAWPLPNTYYAKLHDDTDRFRPFGWNEYGWKYLRNWALASAWGFLAPLAGPVMAGIGGKRGWIGVGAGAVLLLVLIPGLGWPKAAISWTEPALLVQGRVLTLCALAALLPLVGLGRRGDAARTLAWGLLVAVIFFTVYSGGDWMKGFRWLSMAQVPLAVLLTDFLAQLLPRIARGRTAAGLLVAGPVLIAGVVYTGRFLSDVETSPYDVYARVRYMKGVQQRLHLDHAVTMEVDFGAQMWWTGHELLDMAGLNDVPMAHHEWENAFVREYVFEERVPDFAHAHGSWADRAGMKRQAAFRRDYLEIPGYPAGRRYFHVGNHIRRDLFVQPSWAEGTHRETTFGRGPRLVGLDVPAAEVAAGQALYVELGWAMDKARVPDFRALLFLSGPDRLLVWELPPGYDWYPPQRWRRGEVIVGRHTLPLPADLPVGSYDLGLVVITEEGSVLASRATPEDPRYARGEARWDGVVEVVPLAEAERHTAEAASEALAHAADLRCDDAEAALARGRRHLAPDHPAQPRSAEATIAAMATCWARAAERTDDPAEAEDAIRRARRWDHRDPEVERVALRLADFWQAEGEAELASEEPDLLAASTAWRRALVAEPHRSWLRRRAEELRDRRLGIGAKEDE